MLYFQRILTSNFEYIRFVASYRLHQVYLVTGNPLIKSCIEAELFAGRNHCVNITVVVNVFNDSLDSLAFHS